MKPSKGKSVHELFGRPPAPRTGRDRIVAAGIELFYRHGFQTIGLDRVLEHADVTKTAFYKHFDTKDELMLECVRTRDRWEREAWERAVRRIGGEDPRDCLLAFFDVLDRWFNDPDFHGCIFVNAATEFSDPRDPIHRAAAAHKLSNHEFFRGLAAEAGAEDPDAFADHFTVLVEGTLALRHVYGRDDAARTIRPAVRALLERELRQGEPGASARRRS